MGTGLILDVIGLCSDDDSLASSQVGCMLDRVLEHIEPEELN